MKTYLQKQFDAMVQNNGIFPIFEIAVIDKRTNEREYIVFDIFLTQRSLVAQHEATTTKEANSKKIAFCKVRALKYFTLDANLQELWAACIDKINESEFFELAD
jgi:hypothetical protein